MRREKTGYGPFHREREREREIEREIEIERERASGRESAASPPRYSKLAAHPGVELRANLKSISHKCHLFEVSFIWELTKDTVHLPLGCLKGGSPPRNSSPSRHCRSVRAGCRANMAHIRQSRPYSGLDLQVKATNKTTKARLPALAFRQKSKLSPSRSEQSRRLTSPTQPPSSP